MDQFLPWLRQVPLFQGLPDEHVLALAPRMGRGRLVAGEFLCRPGDPSGCCWFVARGSLEVLSAGGRKVAEVKAGGAFGLPGLLVDGPRQIAACAQEETWVFRLDRSAWDEVLAEGGGPALSLAGRVAGLLAAQLRQIDGVLDRLEAPDHPASAEAERAAAAAAERERRIPGQRPAAISEEQLNGWLAEQAAKDGMPDLDRVRSVPSAEKPIRPGPGPAGLR